VTFNIFFIAFNLALLVCIYADRGRSYWDILDTPTVQLCGLTCRRT